MIGQANISYRTPRVRWRIFFQYTFVLCMVLNFRSIWLSNEALEGVGRIIKLMMGLSVVGGFLLSDKLHGIRLQRCFFAIFSIALYLSIWYLNDMEGNRSFMSVIIQLFAIIVYCYFIEDTMEDTMHKFSNIVFVIGIASIIFWLFGSLAGIIKPTGYIYSTWTGDDTAKWVASYYGVYFETQSSDLFGMVSDSILHRNTAIFTEAPMASFVFCMAFLSEFLMRNKINRHRVSLFILFILSTMSTTGVITLVLAFCLRYILNMDRKRRSAIILLLPIIVVACWLVLDFFISQKLATSSGSTRADDFMAGYKAWMTAPLFGRGDKALEVIQYYMSYFRKYNLGFSNSPMLILSSGGIYLFLPYLLSTIKGIAKVIRRGQWHKMAFYFLFLFMFVITICPFQMLTFYMFVSMAITISPRKINVVLNNKNIKAYNG